MYWLKEDSNTSDIASNVENSKSSNRKKFKKIYNPIQKTGLRDIYTFDNFIQGDGNIWAKSAALAVSEDPGLTYNPLFIYGGPGLGKTHLLNALGNEILKKNPNTRVKYIPAESFINEFLDHLRLNDMDNLKKTIEV